MTDQKYFTYISALPTYHLRAEDTRGGLDRKPPS